MLRPIADVAADLGISPDHLLPVGRHKAKIDLAALSDDTDRAGRLVLVSAITPTPAGEGKTTTSIGLAQGLRAAGERVCVALREPSLGPCFGVKGGGTGGGRSTIEPSTDINLHFTGDFHAITAAHNLLAAAIDNHVHHGNELGIDLRRVTWPRVLDVNDRSLRRCVTGLGGPSDGVPRQTGFDITAASEIMAMLCLAEGPDDLRARIDRTLIAFTGKRRPVFAGQLGITGALMALLKDAMLPNLVQTADGTPAVVHGGPFANIAHGCNSIIATRMAMRHADWTITEAGFGFDLGAEKFFDIKCVQAGLNPCAVVLVATVRALKMHGGVALADLRQADPDAVRRGLANLDKHVENIRIFGVQPLVALNRFDADDDAEVAVVADHCAAMGVPFAESRHFAEGAAGAAELAGLLREVARCPDGPVRPLYQPEDSVADKIRAVATRIYGAESVDFTKDAERALQRISRLGYAHLPVCIAKTQNSLSDNPRLRGRPRGFEITVRDVVINSGAGFLVVLTGDILRMPGLPRSPQAERIDLVDGEIVGVG
ncbi:MAG: formate--tetrahydrofolate ligase [Deltaproteobacteria bacterium]|nr:MAG: formate--tetrahydrofolate ligase [Deltaproteobacteria bacterium]